MVPTVQERDAGLSTACRSLWTARIRVVGLKFDTMTDAEDPILFAKKLGVQYPLAVAPDDLRQKFGGIEGLPTTMLYDRQGTLRYKVVGFEYTEAFEADLKPLL